MPFEIQETGDHDNPASFYVPIGDEGAALEIKVTHEGIILDAWEDDGTNCVGTMGMMFDEWFHKVKGN